MRLKCDNCIHEEVCKFKPQETYPQFMKRIVSENCKHFLNKYAARGTAGDEVQPERCRYNTDISCCYPIEECVDCPANPSRERGGI